MELPKIISVDDHVVEPRHVWQTWLPKKFREKGPRVEQAKWAPFEHKPGAKYTNVALASCSPIKSNSSARACSSFSGSDAVAPMRAVRRSSTPIGSSGLLPVLGVH